MASATPAEPATHGRGVDAEPSLGVPRPLVVAMAVTLGIALAARFAISSPLWLDEALSVNIAKLPLHRIPDALRHDGHPPLFYVLLHGWIQLVGTGDRAVRALSGIITLATLPLVWLSGRRLGGQRLGWIAVGVFGLSPFVLRYGSETRMYALVMALSFGGYLLVANSLERTTVWRIAGVAAVAGALLWTHYWSFWLLAALGVLLVIEVIRAHRRRDAAHVRRALLLIVALAVGALTFVPWLGVFLYQMRHTGTPWAPAYRPATLIIQSLTEFAGGPYSESQLLMLGMTVLLVIGLFGRGVDDWHIELDLRTRPEIRQVAMILGVTVGLAITLGVATRTAFAPRYAAAFFPFFALLLAAGLDHFRGRALRSVAMASFVVLSLVGLLVVFRLQRSEAGAVADAMVKSGVPTALVVVCPDQLGPSISRTIGQSARRDDEVVSYPRLNSPARIDWVDYATRNARNDPAAVAEAVLERAGNRPVFLAMSVEYLTVMNQCSDLLAHLSTGRSNTRRLLDADPKAYYETASLYLLMPS